jgi:mercuric ion transport protein
MSDTGGSGRGRRTTRAELIYDRDCPNVPKARARLLRAFAEEGVSPRWLEWEREDPASPTYVRGYGSPTILVDGKDVEGVLPSNDIRCCRLYAHPLTGFQWAPSVESIVSALRGGGQPGSDRGPGQSGRWRSFLAVLPGAGIASLPKLACPACWPAYAGLASSLGLGFLLETTYLFPLTLLFLGIAVAALGFRANRRRGRGPLRVGLLASAIVLVGKFVFDSDALVYGGIAALVAASLWNGWPRKVMSERGCPACVPEAVERGEALDRETTAKEVRT